MAPVDLAGKAMDETRQLHAFFVVWFRGDAGPMADFATCEASLAPNFRMVTPDGRVHNRAAVIERLRSARASAAADFAIEILEPRAAWQSRDAVLLEFIERQYRDGRVTSRRSSGLFTEEPTAPRGVVWRHLQETWMQSGDEGNIQMRTGSPPRREA
jgi:hypothetical protein